MGTGDSEKRSEGTARLDQALSASLWPDWITKDSSEAIRGQYPDGPSKALPAYYRKDHLYWSRS
jgi:hypothetical protein